jgi:hypothetical protein
MNAAQLHEIVTRILVLIPLALGAVVVLWVLLAVFTARGSRGRRY